MGAYINVHGEEDNAELGIKFDIKKSSGTLWGFSVCLNKYTEGKRKNYEKNGITTDG